MTDKKLVLLYHPRTFHEKSYRFFYIPYSLLALASMCDREHYEIRIFDANLQNSDSSASILRQLCLDGRLLCVGISSMIGHQIRGGIDFANLVRALDPSVPIIWGGPLAGVLPELTISHPMVDILIEGQGQRTFLDVVVSLKENDDLRNIKGIRYKTIDQQILKTPSRAFEDWSKFPRFQPVFDLIDIRHYVRNDEHINTRTLNYHSSQGCPFNCGFCSEVALWKHRWGGFSPEVMVQDIQYLVTVYGVNGIKFYDAEFFINHGRVLAFAELVLQRGLSIRWAAAIHPLNFMKLSNQELNLLSQSGLSRLLIGAESGVQDELDLIGKGTTPEMMEVIARHCSRFNIVACFSFVTGYPGFPLEHIKQSIAFASRLRQIGSQHECKVHLYGPYPGTPLYARALEYGFVPPASLEEWSYHDYYEITTPWIPGWIQRAVRHFNEENYIYMSHLTATTSHVIS